MASKESDSTWFGKEAYSSLRRFWNLRFSRPSLAPIILPKTSPERTTTDKEDTILYLAYGSNLAAKTFRGARGIKPLSAINVHAPSLSLAFDLPGLPYLEPCFANSRYRDSASSNAAHKSDYRKDRWHKGLIGVVYEVTPEDYRTIIATEGGGAGYQDIVIPCYALADDPIVSPTPSGTPFKVHTLLQPQEDSKTGGKKVKPVGLGGIQRPDPSYAQPSARYLKLLTDGAEEHSLPSEYLAFLFNIRPYSITTNGQRIGLVVFLAAWGPLLLILTRMGKVLADKNGRIPKWIAVTMGAAFRLMWGSYDLVFKGIFGDGERTIGQGGAIGVVGKKMTNSEWPEDKKDSL